MCYLSGKNSHRGRGSRERRVDPDAVILYIVPTNCHRTLRRHRSFAYEEIFMGATLGSASNERDYQKVNRLILAEQIAKEAGELLKGLQSKDLQTSDKGLDGLCSTADILSAALIVKRLKEAFPGDNILAEDGGGVDEDGSSPTWIIDPIDGTTNFLHGLPFYTVSMACVSPDKTPIASVVFAPMLDLLFAAPSDGAATCNGRQCGVSRREVADKALVLTGFTHRISPDSSNFISFVTASSKTMGTRRSGCASLDLCFVAHGWGDVYFHHSLKCWDTAAAVHIVRAAGGVALTLSGNVHSLDDKSIVAGNHPLCMDLIRLLAMSDTLLPENRRYD